MEMDGGQSVEMELTSISCKGVKASFNLFQKPALYAVVSVSGDADRAQKTPVDRVGGENPEWDHPIRLDVGDRTGGVVLDFEVKAQGMLTDSTVGRARIPLADLDFCGDLRHASYQVRSPDGKSNGAISFSYKVNGLDLPDECCVAAALELDLPSPRPPLSFKVNDDPDAIKYPTVDPHPPPPVFDYNHHQQPPAAAFGYGHPQPPPAFDYGHQAAAPPFVYGRRELAPDPAGSSPPPGYGYGWPAQPTAAGGGKFYPPQAPAYAAYPPPQAPAYAAYPPPPQAPAYAAYPPPPQAPAYGAYPPPPAYGPYHPQPPPTCCYHEPHGLNEPVSTEFLETGP